MTIQCPNCSTAYTADRCGVNIPENKNAIVTVVCVLCKGEFDVIVTWFPEQEAKPGSPAVVPGWWSRVVMRKPIVPEIPDKAGVPAQHRVESRSR
jgi:hypothetical protein